MNLSWLYIGPLWVLIFLGNHRHVPVVISHIPIGYLDALTLLASFAVSDILLEIAEAIKPTWRAWVALILTIPMFAVDLSFINMLRELGLRIGQP